MNICFLAKDELSKDLVSALKVIGSPFAQKEEEIHIDTETARRLYALTQKNKIGLLFLETMNKRFPQAGLKNELLRQRSLKLEQFKTIERVTTILEGTQAEFLVIKTLADYPYVASDVDVLIMGNRKSYHRALQALRQSGFVQVEHAVLQNCLHDSTRADHTAIGKKDVYDVDLYHEISASRLIYLNKRRLGSTTTRKMVDSVYVPVLNPEAELLLVIFHSVYPEQLFTLYHYYTILYFLHTMSRKSLSIFLELVQKQRATYPVRVALNMAATLHYAAHEFVPSILVAILRALNVSDILHNRLFHMPYRYKITHLLLTLGLKLNDGLFRESFKRQMMAIFTPRYLDYLIKVAIDRRLRETY